MALFEFNQIEKQIYGNKFSSNIIEINFYTKFVKREIYMKPFFRI